ncbi:PREDICTED: neuropeptide FF receptor 2-like [Branchiostoma belcheri]|uniref:Neuropeptide FF receptor 2-like n=1 Tax=Branchiostoma belcheri TaxID=7741 RepID=A0A6P4ZZQ7_BRABE|nr:PREDICTED: neuropeptide FF receptor 2-like [Branchiostoma belcheri]
MDVSNLTNTTPAPAMPFYVHGPVVTGLYIVGYCLVFSLNVVGNAVVCWVIASTPRLHTATNYFILNLAVADLLVAVFCIPFTLVEHILYDYQFGEVMCKLNRTIQGVSVAASVYTLSAIAVERYYVVLYPADLCMGSSTVRKALAAIWGAAVLIMLPQLFVLGMEEYSFQFRGGETATYCGENWPTVEYRQAYTLALFVLVYCGPLAAVTCIYCRIGVSIWYRSAFPLSSTSSSRPRVIGQDTNKPRVMGQVNNQSRVIGQDPNQSQVMDRNINQSQVIGQDSNQSQVLGSNTNQSQVMGQDSGQSQVMSHDPGQSKVMGQDPGGSQVIGQDPGGSQVMGQDPGESQVMGQDPGESQVMGQKPSQSQVMGQKSGQSQVMSQDPNQSQVMGQESDQSRVTGQVPKRRLRVTKMLVTVVAIFALSWLPLYVSWMLDDFGSLSAEQEETLFKYVYPIAHWVGYFNSCVNPIIYGLFRSDVRKNLPSRASSRGRKASMTTSRKRTSVLGRYIRRKGRQETAL